MPCSIPSRLSLLQGRACEGRGDFLPHLGGRAFASGTRPKYLGSVVPTTDNYYATLEQRRVLRRLLRLCPAGRRCRWSSQPISGSTNKNTGQFERTLIIADKGSLCFLSRRMHGAQARRESLHAAVVELIAHDDAEIKYSTVQNWYPVTRTAAAESIISSPSAAIAGAQIPRFPGLRSRPDRRSPGNIHPVSCAATIRAASSTRSRFPMAASRSILGPR